MFVVELESVVDGKVQEHHWFQTVPVNNLLMSRIECTYCLISASYLAGLFDIFILLHI